MSSKRDIVLEVCKIFNDIFDQKHKDIVNPDKTPEEIAEIEKQLAEGKPLHFLLGSGHSAKSLFMSGDCLCYAEMLEKLFPEGKIYMEEAHFMFKYENIYYDATLRPSLFINQNASPLSKNKNERMQSAAALISKDYDKITEICNDIIKNIREIKGLENLGIETKSNQDHSITL